MYNDCVYLKRKPVNRHNFNRYRDRGSPIRRRPHRTVRPNPKGNREKDTIHWKWFEKIRSSSYVPLEFLLKFKRWHARHFCDRKRWMLMFTECWKLWASWVEQLTGNDKIARFVILLKTASSSGIIHESARLTHKRMILLFVIFKRTTL